SQTVGGGKADVAGSVAAGFDCAAGTTGTAAGAAGTGVADMGVPTGTDGATTPGAGSAVSGSMIGGPGSDRGSGGGIFGSVSGGGSAGDCAATGAISTDAAIIPSTIRRFMTVPPTTRRPSAAPGSRPATSTVASRRWPGRYIPAHRRDKQVQKCRHNR